MINNRQTSYIYNPVTVTTENEYYYCTRREDSEKGKSGRFIP